MANKLFSVSVVAAACILIVLTVAAFERNRDYKTPVTLWASASSISKDKRRTHENYGQALSTAGMLDEALRQFQTVLALRDDGSVPPRDVYREIGVVYFRMGLMDDAITSWQTGLNYAPGDPSLLNNLSVAFIQKHDFVRAEAAVRQALKADPNMPHLLNTMGEILMDQNKFEEALKYFLQAIQMGPEEPARYWNAALAFERNGRYKEAYEYASQFEAMAKDMTSKQQAQMYMNMLQWRYLSKKQAGNQ